MTENTPRSAQRVVGQQMVSSPLECDPAARQVPGHHMNHAPRGTVRRSAEGALLVREFRGDNEGWKLVPPQSGHCAFFPDREIDPAWLDWPIIWCPDTTFHEQDNIRRAHVIRGVAASALYTPVHEPYGSEVVDKQLPRAATEEPQQRGYLARLTMTETVSNLMEANLLGVFNEHDAQQRAVTIESTYAPDIRWTDDDATRVGREALEAKATAVQSQTHGLVFTKASPVYQTRGFGYLAWKLGPGGGHSVASGFDVAVVRNDLISEIYTVITTGKPMLTNPENSSQPADISQSPPAAAGGDDTPSHSALLVVKRGPNAGSRFLLDQPVTTAGRHASSDIFLDDITVSRDHAEFRWDSGEIRVVDIGSLNGTYVNRKPVDSVVLANGDEIQIGRFRLVFLSSPRPVDTEDPTQTVLPHRVPRIVHKSDNELCSGIQRNVKL